MGAAIGGGAGAFATHTYDAKTSNDMKVEIETLKKALEAKDAELKVHDSNAEALQKDVFEKA